MILLLIFLAVSLAQPSPYNITIPPSPSPNLSTATFTTPSTLLATLSHPKIHPINTTVFDWWYFDAISSSNPNVSLAVTLFTSTRTAFPFLPPSTTGVNSLLLSYTWLSFPNGTVYASYADASLATLTAANGVTQGAWAGRGASVSWSGSESGVYEVGIASDDSVDGLGVNGAMRVSSVANPHTPCGDERLRLGGSSVGWASLVPDAEVRVDVVAAGERVVFTGFGYHDKNWSDAPFAAAVRAWYWGRGRVGPYSVVWFDFLPFGEEEVVSGYVAVGREVVVSGCEEGVVSVRPTRNGTVAAYPPVLGDVPDGFRVVYSMGLEVDVSLGAMVAGDGEHYLRWTGTMSAELEGKVYEGVGIFEQFVMQ